MPMGENLFEEEFTVEALSLMGNPLERLSRRVDFEMFRPILEEALLTKEVKSAAGRKPIDVVLMFKVIFLQRYYGLGDHQIQYQIIDRTSFRQFLGIHTVAEVPDEKTVWACRNRLSQCGAFDHLFDEFRSYLDSLGLSFSEGKIIDATFVEAPHQHNTHEENRQIKAGNGKDLWQAEDGDSAKEKKRDGLLRYLESALAGAPFDTAKCKVSYRKSKKVEVDDEFLGWAILHRTDLVRYSAPQPNKDEIKRCLAKGDSLAGVAPEIEHARLVDTVSMSVK